MRLTYHALAVRPGFILSAAMLLSCRRIAAVAALFLAVGAVPAQALELRVSADALERTLRKRVFNAPDKSGALTRRYLRGDAQHPCSVYAEDPHVTFKDDRLHVSVRTHANFGKNMRGFCLGIPIVLESEVSFVPEAEGESIGFRDARIEHVSQNAELDLLLEPFLAGRMPAEMKVNAAQLMRTLLVRAPDSTGYTLTLDALKLQSMEVQADVLLVNLDASISVR